ncbi:protein of unknown function [Methylocella tundrae]|uniref:Uncharacterized protein n=1 Tax=Methylocella tundrae TaxID=227605 RepID=A0A4U8Z2R7_METTU|nr:protein of unknown function [Methylocella tundrae]
MGSPSLKERQMLQHLRPALVMLALFTVLTGVIYPFALTGFAAIALPGAANGSLIKKGRRHHRLEPHRADFHQGRLFPQPPVGDQRSRPE